jgi:pyruvate/2-oxoglutarate dehydrogenase complex dihydrolipoamide dehydrogenase (E3) component
LIAVRTESDAEPSLIPPADEFNQLLVGNVHPPAWVNPTPASHYHLVVIGAGTAGLVTAAGAAGLGARVALVERHLMGGDCLNYGCVPSKALLSAARVAATVRAAGEFGVHSTGELVVDFGQVMERLRRLRAGISRHDSAQRFRELGVDVFLGQAEFQADGRHVRVGNDRLKFGKAVLCTGARAAAPSIPGLKEAGYLTNETLFSLTELPQRLAVIGGGPIGSEMAQAFARFGAEVTLFEAADHILGRDDAEAARIVQAALERDGVRIVPNSQVTEVRQAGDSRRVLFTQESSRQELDCDAILVAVGRAPNVEGLNLDTIGVEFDQRSGVKVNDRLQTTNPRIYAAGDICFPYKFTHTADFLARIVIQNALFLGRAKASALTIPWCTYTSPELAHVGLSDVEARRRGIPVTTLVQPLRDIDRAVLDGEGEGFVKVHLRRGTDRILGATIVAAHAGDLISELSVALRNGVGLKGISATIHPYPTQAEAIRRLGDQYNRARLTPTVKWLLKSLLQWTAR